MPALATVTKTGNSATIVLPSDLRKANGIHIGDQIELSARPDGIIELRKVAERMDRQQAFDEALDFFKSVEWQRSARQPTQWIRCSNPTRS